MKPRIPFRIGYQYSNWELNLDVTLPDRIPDNEMYVSYLWIGKNKPFLNFTPDKTELIFYWDRLCTVILTFEKKDRTFYSELNDVLAAKFGLPKIVFLHNCLEFIYLCKRGIEYRCTILHQHTIIITYEIKI